jgi:hypothetical protein
MCGCAGLVGASDFDVAQVRQQLQQSPSTRSLLASSASSPTLHTSASVHRGLSVAIPKETRTPAYVKSTFNHVLDARRPATSPLSIASLPGYGFQTPKATTTVPRNRTPFAQTTPITQPSLSVTSSAAEGPQGTTTIEPMGITDITTTSEPSSDLTLVLPAEPGSLSHPAPASSGRKSNNLVMRCSSFSFPFKLFHTPVAHAHSVIVTVASLRSD